MTDSLATAKRPHRVRFELSTKTIATLILVAASLWLLFRLGRSSSCSSRLSSSPAPDPAVRWLEEKRVRRGLGIAIVFAVFFILALCVAAVTLPALVSQAAALLEHEPALRARLADRLAGSRLSLPPRALAARPS